MKSRGVLRQLVSSLATATCCIVLNTPAATGRPCALYPRATPAMARHAGQYQAEDNEDSREAGWKRREILQLKEGRSSSGQDADYDTEMIVIPVLVLMAVIGLLRLRDF